MKKLVLLVGAFLSSFSVGAFAALPAEATAAFSSISTAVTDVGAAAWPIIASVLVLFATIKLVKRATGKL
jgi:Phage major coat protein, Gp8.